MDFSKKLKQQINGTIKQSSLSRDQIADKMSELAGKSISIHQLYAWTASSKRGHYFPAEFIPAFILATSDYSLLDLICSEVGGNFIKIEQLIEESAKIDTEIRRLEARKIELAILLGAAGGHRKL